MGNEASRKLLSLTIAAGVLVSGCGEKATQQVPAASDSANQSEGKDENKHEGPPAGAAAPNLNSAPEIAAVRFEPEEPSVGETLRVVVDASDADGDTPWLRYSWKVDGVASGSDAAKLSLTGASKGQRIEVAVVASDGRDESGAFTALAVVANARPIIRRLEVEPASDIMAGIEITARPEARDADGDSLSFQYTWAVNDRHTTQQGPVFSTEGLRRGDVVRATGT